MRSGWFWNTDMWEEYQQAYYAGRERPEVYKSSPLADDHEFPHPSAVCDGWIAKEHQTQVIDLRTWGWSDIRKSYHSLIHGAQNHYCITPEQSTVEEYRYLHVTANGAQPRSDATYAIQGHWVKQGYGLLVTAKDYAGGRIKAASYWILYQHCAYYMSGPSVERNVQHGVIFVSLMALRERGIRLVEMGQLDGATQKERNIGIFKAGFGGQPMPYTEVRQCS